MDRGVDAPGHPAQELPVPSPPHIARTRPPGSAKGRGALAAVALGAVYTAYVLRFWHSLDEAFIGFRYARHLAAGLGLRFNPGGEGALPGFDSALWVLGLAPAEALGLPVPLVANLVSWGCGLVVLAAVYRSARAHLGVRPAAAWLSTLALALCPPFVVWSTSGLETMAWACLGFLAFEQTVLARRIRVARAGTLLAGLALVRPEGLLWAALIAGVGAAARVADGWRRDAPLPATARRGAARRALPALLSLLIALPPWGLWQLGRGWLAEPGLSGASVAAARSGLTYIGTAGTTALLPVVALLACWPVVRRRPEVAGPAIAVTVAIVGWAAATGGDVLPFGRLLVPALPLTALLAALLLDHAWSRYGAALPVTAALVAIVVGLAPLHDRPLAPRAVRAALQTRDHPRVRTEHQQWAAITRHVGEWRLLGALMAEHSAPGESWATAPIGARGYTSGLEVHDRSAAPPGDDGLRALARRGVTTLDARVVEPHRVPDIVAAWKIGGPVQRGYRPESVTLAAGRTLLRLRRSDPGSRASGDRPRARDRRGGQRRRGSRADAVAAAVQVVDPQRSSDVLRLYSSGHAPDAWLVDARGGARHRWRMPFRQAFPELRAERKRLEAGRWRQVALRDDGSIVGLFDGLGLVAVGPRGDLLWSRPGAFHSALDVDGTGRITTLQRASVEGAVDAWVDHLVQLDADGEVLRAVDVRAALAASPWGALLEGAAPSARGLLGLSGLHVIPQAPSGMPVRAGQVLLSSRALRALLVVDPAEERVVWALAAGVTEPYDPSLLPGGTLLVYDASGGPDGAAAVELDPSGRVVWSWAGEPDAPLRSRLGAARRLTNGNTLITDATAGRAVEVTPEGRVVWRFSTPHRTGSRGRATPPLFPMVPLPADLPAPWARVGGAR